MNILGYKGIPILKYFEHLDAKWCILDTAARKKAKDDYYIVWDPSAEHITVFGKRLDDDQEWLKTLGVDIPNSAKLQHYLEQIYASVQFDRMTMQDWEKWPADRKTWDEAKPWYFEDETAKLEQWEKNSGGTAASAKYESAANAEEQEAAVTAEIRSYLEGIAAKSEADRELLQAVRSEMKEKEAKTEAVLQAKDANICQLVDQVKQLTKATQEQLIAKAADGPPSNKKQRRQQQ